MEFSAFRAQLRQELAAVGDAGRAEQQRRYLKSEMPLYGVGVPTVRRIAQALALQYPSLWTATTWAPHLQRLWDEAELREERYAALAVVRSKVSKEFAPQLNALPLYEHFIRTGQWWDLVDETTHGVGLVLRHHPQVGDLMRTWAVDPNAWIRRSSILSQLQFKGKVNTQLLTDVIESNQHDGDFFIRKAIGWALRDYARTAPGWVRAFIASHPELSALSRREATKHL